MKQDNFYSRVNKLILETNKAKEVKENLKTITGQAKINYNTYFTNQRLGKIRLPRADEAVEIAKILGTSVEYLVTGELPDFYKLQRKTLLRYIRYLENDLLKLRTSLTEGYKKDTKKN